ncbi:hypothetical protein [Paenibacillus sp. FSL R7-0337]|uniref:hypothetical protein n=1 Tax=Paenibacillus sp. FSL R7-0337 TaxID=1926588 RepID=UPI0009701E1C|nr:hypothetical protein [Paenibacillus sp. FSL R7-0337]OMF98174.1 hypothetical protein BK147_11170 [Paenibacillus sp. FSL R7-0337]
MKKIGLLLVGIIIGAGLTLSPQIYGAGAKLLGAKVDKTLDIKLNGNSIGQGAVIDGTSYLPVRAAANALGLEVSVDSKQVDLQGKSSEELAEIAKKQQADMDKNEKIASLKSQIEISKSKVASYAKAVESGEKMVETKKQTYDEVMNNPNAGQEGKDLETKTYELAKQALETRKANLAAEQANLADLESQLAELQK